MRARYHGQWTEAQKPTKYAETYIPVTDATSIFDIPVPRGERWLIRGWGIGENLDPLITAFDYALISVFDRETQTWRHIEHKFELLDAAQATVCFTMANAMLNPIILQSESIIRIRGYYLGLQQTGTCLKAWVWYEQLDAIEKEPERESIVE